MTVQTNVSEGLTQINLMLVDETNSWTKYVLNVTIEPIESPFFEYINNMSKQQLINGVILNITSPNKIDVVDCNNYQEISWIIFSNSTLKLITNTTNYNQTWLRLASTDSCSNKVYSNLFQIISTQRPLVSTNKFGPLSVLKGIYTLFEIPGDLFIDFDNNSLTYNSSIISWSQNYFWDIGIKQSLDKTNYLYVFSNFSMNWNASISASNLYSKSEIVFNIDIIKWASKNCAKCSGPSQSQCTEWKSAYQLSSSGMWLYEANYFAFQGLTFYQIWSNIIFACTMIHIFLSFAFGRNLLNSIINIQLIIVLMLCSNRIDFQLQELLSNILFVKFDFGFLHQFAFARNIIWCEAKFERMIELQFFCQSTAQNYFFIVLVWLLSVLFWSLLRKHLFRWTLFIADLYVKVQNFICIFWKFSQPNADYPKHIAEWMFINIFSMFAIISLTNDVINLDEYFITSSLSLIMILVFLVYLYRTKFEMFSLKFITEMEIEYQLIYENNLFKL